jgi:hypothetical protein
MIAPNNLRFRDAPAFGIDETHAFAQRKSCAYHGQASRLAYVHGDAIGLLSFGAFFPFDLEFYPRDDTPMGAQFFPSLFKSPTFGDSDGICSSFGGHACLAACGFVTRPVYSKRQGISLSCDSQ